MADKNITYLDPNHIVIVGIDTAATTEDTLYDERIDLDVDINLVKNIMVYGVQQPVLVRAEDGDVIVVDGRQRVRAAREANKQFRAAGEVEVKVPVLSVRGDDRRVTGIMISANEQGARRRPSTPGCGSRKRTLRFTKRSSPGPSARPQVSRSHPWTARSRPQPWKRWSRRRSPRSLTPRSRRARGRPSRE
jgi:ParB family chromosome partitioning protein